VAVKRVFEDHAYKVNVSSTKSQLGHLLGASGGVELVISLTALGENVCPPTINLDTPDPACDLNYTPNKPQARKIDAVMSNSFGFGGHNASIIAGRLS
jgi:3-oxoacyl-[acyl-carrier-protein] synthase II